MSYGEKTGPNQYKPNTTLQIHRDLAEGKVVVGTMFRNVDRLGTMYEEDSTLAKAADRGYRFVVLDCEHKAFNEETLAVFAQEAHEIGISPWVRPEQSEHAFISKYADTGFSGFMIPNVMDTIRAQDVVDQAYYYPIARNAQIVRGYSLGPVILDGQKFETVREELDYANANMCVTIQTEHPIGMKNLEAILSIQGVNATIIGPNDLAINMDKEEGIGLTELPKDNMYRHESMIKAYKKIGEITNRAGKFAGIHFSGAKQMDLVEMLVSNMGYRLIVLGTDANFTDKEIIATKRQIEQITSIR